MKRKIDGYVRVPGGLKGGTLFLVGTVLLAMSGRVSSGAVGVTMMFAGAGLLVYEQRDRRLSLTLQNARDYYLSFTPARKELNALLSEFMNFLPIDQAAATTTRANVKPGASSAHWLITLWLCGRTDIPFQVVQGVSGNPEAERTLLIEQRGLVESLRGAWEADADDHCDEGRCLMSRRVEGDDAVGPLAVVMCQYVHKVEVSHEYVDAAPSAFDSALFKVGPQLKHEIATALFTVGASHRIARQP